MTDSSSYVPLPPDRRPPWRPRVSTQIMLLVVTVACMGFAYGARHWHAYVAHQRDREIAQLLESLGGKTRYLGESRRAFCLEFEPTERVLQDDGMQLVVQMDALDYIDLRRTAITDRGLKQLYKLPDLRCVRLDLHSFSEQAVTELMERMPQVRVEPRQLSRTSTVGGFRAICNAMESTHGPLWEGSFKVRMPSEVLPYLSEIEHLTSVDLSKSKTQDRDLRHLRKLGRLQVLKLNGTQLTDLCLPHLEHHEDLREVFLLDTDVSRTGVEYLFERLPKGCRVHWIEGKFRKGKIARTPDIFARDPSAVWNSVDWFETHSDLIRLQIVDRYLDNLQLDQLGQSFANLKDLELYRVGVVISDAEKPAPLASLRFLRLSHCDLSDEVLEFVATLPALEVLDLSHTNLTAAGLKQLENSAMLVEIDLTGTTVSDESVEQFRQAQPGCAVLRGDSKASLGVGSTDTGVVTVDIETW